MLLIARGFDRHGGSALQWRASGPEEAAACQSRRRATRKTRQRRGLGHDMTPRRALTSLHHACRLLATNCDENDFVYSTDQGLSWSSGPVKMSISSYAEWNDSILMSTNEDGVWKVYWTP